MKEHRPVIGEITTYVGDQIPAAKGQRVRIVGVLRGALCNDADVDLESNYVTDSAILARFGGVTKEDRVEVVFLRPDGSTILGRYDPRAIDLALFAHLAETSEAM